MKDDRKPLKKKSKPILKKSEKDRKRFHRESVESLNKAMDNLK